MRLLVIGDSGIDIHQYGETKRRCPEAPCLVFHSLHKVENEGMAANVVANLEALGKDLEIDFITNVNKPIKIRYVDFDSNQMLMRHDINDHIGERFSMDKIKSYDYSALIVSDYNKGYLTEDDLHYLSLNFRLSFLDTKKVLGEWASAFTFIKINEPESIASEKGIFNYISEESLIITKGSKGATYNRKDYPAEKVEMLYDVSGAGDSFLAGLVYNYLQTNDIHSAISFANVCSGKVVQKRGVSTI